jgi:multicomponent Na+:H+ antiporter subunit B
VDRHGGGGCRLYRSFGRGWCQYGLFCWSRFSDIKEDKGLKIIGLIVAVLTGGLLVYASGDFPAWSDPASPASTHLSPHFIEKAVEETSVPNIVTAVLADYRGFDTMFETAVIFSAGVAVFLLLRTSGPKTQQTRLYRHQLTGVTVRRAAPIR